MVLAFLFCLAVISKTALRAEVTRAGMAKAATAFLKPRPLGLAFTPMERLEKALTSAILVFSRDCADVEERCWRLYFTSCSFSFPLDAKSRWGGRWRWGEQSFLTRVQYSYEYVCTHPSIIVTRGSRPRGTHFV